MRPMRRNRNNLHHCNSRHRNKVVILIDIRKQRKRRMSSGVFSPAIQNAFLNVSTHNGDTLSTAALSLTVTLIDSIFERVILQLLQLPKDSTESLFRDMLPPDAVARIDALFLSAKNNTNNFTSAAIGPFQLTPSLLRARVRDSFADDADNDGNSFHDNQSSVARRRALADSALTDVSLLRVAALLRFVTEKLLSDALQYAQKGSSSPSSSSSSSSLSSSSMFLSTSVGAEVLPQHVQVACEREPMATLMRIVSTPMASSLATAVIGAGSSISASGRGEIDHRDTRRLAEDDDDDDDFDDDLLHASSIVSDTASDAPSGGNDGLPNPLIQTRDPWSSNASQASSTTGWMPPSNAPRFTTAAGVQLQVDDSPLGVARRVWHFIVAEPLGMKHLLCIVILDALLALLVQQ
jgi:hypothetical protein